MTDEFNPLSDNENWERAKKARWSVVEGAVGSAIADGHAWMDWLVELPKREQPDSPRQHYGASAYPVRYDEDPPEDSPNPHYKVQFRFDLRDVSLQDFRESVDPNYDTLS
jgi:hypothetical protein